jgi:ABC-type antimicrobial peptide transport system ATPase subunit
MKYSFLIGITVIGMLNFYACSEKQPSIDKAVNELAKFECRAMQLRDKRFVTADKIRFGQDSLLKLIVQKADTTQLHLQLTALSNEKQLLLDQSNQLADSIKQKMEIISTTYFKDKKQQESFNSLLDAALKSEGCK